MRVYIEEISYYLSELLNESLLWFCVKKFNVVLIIFWKVGSFGWIESVNWV